MTRGKDAGFRKKCSCPTSPHWEHPLLFSGNRQILLCACCSSQHSLWFPSPKWISQSPPQVKKEKRFLSLVFLVGMYEIWQGSIQTKERSLRAKASLGLPQQNKFPCKQAKTMWSWSIPSFYPVVYWLSSLIPTDKKKIKMFPEKHDTSKHYYFRGQSLSTWTNILDTWKEEEKMGHVAPGVEAIKWHSIFNRNILWCTIGFKN